MFAKSSQIFSWTYLEHIFQTPIRTLHRMHRRIKLRKRMDEAFDLNDERDILPILEVRVLDEARKSSFRVRRLTHFPVAENMQDMKAALQMFMPDIKDMENWQLGYVLERNKKYTIETDVELQDAFQHFKDGYQMCQDPMPAKAVAAKRRVDTNIQGT